MFAVVHIGYIAFPYRAIGWTCCGLDREIPGHIECGAVHLRTPVLGFKGPPSKMLVGAPPLGVVSLLVVSSPMM